MRLRGTIFAVFLLSIAVAPAWAEDACAVDAATAARIQALIPDIDAYAARGMKAYDVPGLAIGIVAGDKLVYARGFGVRRKGGAEPVDAHTIFQIGSLTKSFLAVTEAIMVDRGKLDWNDRVIDRYPAFQLKDPWVTREFRVFDLLAQRSSLPPLVNDAIPMAGFDEAATIGSLRDVTPITSFRTTFSYTNITHLLASRIVAQAAGAPDWNAVLQTELLDPLGMRDTTYTAEAIEGAANHANGHRWTPQGVVDAVLPQSSRHRLAGAGDINSNVEDMARWMRFQLGGGAVDERQIVSKENLAVTRLPKVAVNDTISYAMGWYVWRTPGGGVLWHDGDALVFGSWAAMAPDKNVGVIILTNESHVGFPNGLGAWMLNRILGNPEVDYLTPRLEQVKASYEATARDFATPANARPSPPLASLTGAYVNGSFGETSIEEDGATLVMKIAATGARYRLTPWDGGTFVAQLIPEGQFGPIVDLHFMTRDLLQFQISSAGKLDAIRLTFENGQPFDFRRR